VQNLNTAKKTAAVNGNMLHANNQRALLAAAKFTAYADLGGQALLGADMVVVGS